MGSSRRTTASGSQAIWTPIRRWVLYSPTRLGVIVAGIIVVLFVIGRLMPDPAPGALSGATAAGGAATSTTATRQVLQAGDEVTRDDALAVTDDAQARKSPQIVAMKYAIAYTDLDATTGQWITALSTFAAPGAVAGEVVAARPVVPIAISGPTSSNSRGELVIVPTSAGQLTVNLESTPAGWQVTTPLPQLDLPEYTPTTTEDAVPGTTTTTPSSELSTSSSATPARPTPVMPQPSRPAEPTPEAGPIPIPELEGPLPGRR